MAQKQTEDHKQYISKQIFDINQELNIITNAEGDTVAAIGAAVDAIGDCLENIESTVTEICDEAHYYRSQADKLVEEVAELEDRIEDIIKETDCVQGFSSMVGEVRYKTDNLADAQTMETFAEVMAIVPPAALLAQLQTLKLLC